MSDERESLPDARAFPIRRWSKRETEIILAGISRACDFYPGAHDDGETCDCPICCLTVLLLQGRDLRQENHDKALR